MLRYSIMVFVGLFAIVTGLVVFFLLADATRKAILDEIVIDSKSNENYADWTSDWDDGDQAIYLNYYLFNLTNPNEWAAGSAKANFAEVGPFVYRRYQNKTNVLFGDGGNDVTWNNHNEYIFQRSASVSDDQTTMIFNINPYYTAAIAQSGNLEAVFNTNLVATNLAAFVAQPSAFGSGTPVGALVPGFAQAFSGAVTLTDAEAIAALTFFAGNAVNLYTYNNMVTAYNTALAAGQATTVAALGAQINATFPNAPDFWTPFVFNGAAATKAGLFVAYSNNVAAGARATLVAAGGSNGGLLFRKTSARNHLFGPDPFYYAVSGGANIGYVINHSTPTAVGKAYTVKTGKSSSSVAGMDHHTQANGVTTSTAYVRADGSGPTTVVDGRSNSMSPFQGATPDKIDIYFEDNERYVSFTFNGVQEVEGIETARYLVDGEDYISVNAEYNATDKGFLPVAYWAQGLPFFLSFPHQDYAQTPYDDAITGMSPNAGVHSTYLDLEPITGFPLEARLAAQLNLRMNFSATSYSEAPNVTEKDMMVPLYWFSRTFHINSESASDLKVAVVTAVVLRRAILGSLVGLGVVCVLIGAALMVQKGGNDGVAGGESDKNVESGKKNEGQKQQESELPPDNEPELQPFNPPPPVAEPQGHINNNNTNGNANNAAANDTAPAAEETSPAVVDNGNTAEADNNKAENNGAAADNNNGEQEMEPVAETA